MSTPTFSAPQEEPTDKPLLSTVVSRACMPELQLLVQDFIDTFREKHICISSLVA